MVVESFDTADSCKESLGKKNGKSKTRKGHSILKTCPEDQESYFLHRASRPPIRASRKNR